MLTCSRRSRAALYFILCFLGGSSLACYPASDDASSVSLSELEKTAKAFSIEIVTAGAQFPVKTAFGSIAGKSADGNKLKNYSGLFNPEFGLYPPQLVKRSRLKRVVFCTELSFAGQLRNAIPDFENNTLYLDVGRGSYDTTYQRSVIHHEFFHIIDLRDDGSLYRDERWSALNPPEFKYGTGGRNAQAMATTSVLTGKFPGFLNHYSTTGVEEDKAEVFANLVVRNEYVENRAKTDRVLKTKVNRMKELLMAFCPELNEAFWDRVRKQTRPKN
jgi:hypothetical protein